MFCKMYTDGGARGNPGSAAIGVVIYDQDNKIVKKISKAIGIATNNVAEYTALIIGLQALQDLKYTEVEIFLDSELIVKQITGKYKIKDPKMISLHKKVMQILDLISWTVTHVKRHLNKEADALVNKALDGL